MSDKSPSKDFEGEKICSWCGEHFRQEWSQSRPVCPHCHRLLANAGIGDGEIFGEGKPRESENRDEG
jgi:hypothetical protein